MILAALLVGASTAAAPAPWIHASGTSFVDEAGLAVRLRGINLGNWLTIEGWLCGLNDAVEPGRDIPDEWTLWTICEERFGREQTARLIRAWHDAWMTETDFRQIKAAGFDFVRLPFWHAWLDPADAPAGVADGFDRLDAAITRAKSHGLRVLLDLHGAPGSQNDWDHSGVSKRNLLFKVPGYRDRTVDAWKRLAARYKDEPVVWGYDLLNEPNGGRPEDLHAFHDRLYREIRAVDPRHLIVVEDGLHGLHTMPPPSKYGWKNVAYSVHFYLFGAKSDDEHRRFADTTVPGWRTKQVEYGVPLYIGEFNTLNPWWGLESTRRYVRAFHSFGWAWSPWTWKKVESGNPPWLWGLMVDAKPRPGFPDLRRASFDQLLRHISGYSGNWRLNDAYAAALRDEPSGR